MRSNVVRGRGFRGALEYDLGKGEDAEIVAGTLSGDTPRALAREFGAVRRLRPECQTPVWHTSLSCPAGEHPTQAQWDEAARILLERVGMDPARTPWIAVRHDDTDHAHVHVLASRIDVDGRIAWCRDDAEASQQATDIIERRLGLTVTRERGQDYEPAPRVRIGRKERQMWSKRGVEVPPKVVIAEALDRAVARGADTWEALADAVAKDGVTLQRNKRGQGYRVTMVESKTGEECSYKASDLGKAWAYKAMDARLADRRHEAEGLQQADEAEARIDEVLEALDEQLAEPEPMPVAEAPQEAPEAPPEPPEPPLLARARQCREDAAQARAEAREYNAEAYALGEQIEPLRSEASELREWMAEWDRSPTWRKAWGWVMEREPKQDDRERLAEIDGQLRELNERRRRARGWAADREREATAADATARDHEAKHRAQQDQGPQAPLDLDALERAAKREAALKQQHGHEPVDPEPDMG